MRGRSAVTVVAAVTIFGTLVVAQRMTTTGTGRGGSPHVRSEWTVDGANLVIEYGRPFLRGRPEEEMMPAGRPWRTGADAATILRTDKTLGFGSVNLPPGAYTIYTQPGGTWQLLLGSLVKDQWGSPYQPALERHRLPMTTSKMTEAVEQVTISIDDTRDGAILRIEWGTTRATAPFTVR